MKIALIDSTVGLLAAAAVLHRLRPDADLVLSYDPDGIPWGPRTPEDITARALACEAVAAQTLRRLGVRPAPAAERSGSLAVIHSGRPAELPGRVAAYPEGRALLRTGSTSTNSSAVTKNALPLH